MTYDAPTASELEYQLQDPGLEAANLLCGDRLRQHGERVTLLNAQLAERESLEKGRIEEIDRAAMKCSGYLEALSAVSHDFRDAATENKQRHLTGILLDLEQQKRSEIERCWADKARLQTEALEANQDYETSARKYRQLMI